MILKLFGVSDFIMILGMSLPLIHLMTLKNLLLG